MGFILARLLALVRLASRAARSSDLCREHGVAASVLISRRKWKRSRSVHLVTLDSGVELEEALFDNRCSDVDECVRVCVLSISG